MDAEFAGITLWSDLRDGLKERLAMPHRAYLPLQTSKAKQGDQLVPIAKTGVGETGVAKEAEAEYVRTLQVRFEDESRKAYMLNWLENNPLVD